LAEKKQDEDWDYWFNRSQPMTKLKLTWQEKWLAKEEDGGSGGSSGKEEQEMASARGGPNPELGNSNSGSGNPNPTEKEDHLGEELTQMDVSMVFMILAEFRAPTKNVTKLALGAERVVFEKPENPSAHMKPLFIRGHLDGTPIRHMLVDGGASINILPLSLFKKLGHVEGELKCTNPILSSFAVDPTKVKGIICKELMVGRKTMPTAFFMVDVKGCYNVLLGRDWIHTNRCVPSTLHQCVIQWIGDKVEVVRADEDVCITITETQVDIQEGNMKCLTGMDLTGYDYVSINKDGFVSISVKPGIGATLLAHDLV
jgi:hypothetical protein